MLNGLPQSKLLIQLMLTRNVKFIFEIEVKNK